MVASPRTSSGPVRSIASFVLIGAIATSSYAQTTDPASSLPNSPKDLLSAFASDPAVVQEITESQRSSQDWIAHLVGLGAAMTDSEMAILSEYLALTMPVMVQGDDVPSMVEALPPDGRELFVANCLSCHGVAAYYLLQDRDAAGWMDIFTAPYHGRLLTGENERETFASYAAHAMPIAESAIPEAWKE